MSYRVSLVAGVLTFAACTPKEEALAESIAAIVQETGTPGLSVAVIEKGEVVWTKAFGVVDKDRGREVTTETLFQAASISKPVAAFGALLLVRDGKLDLDQDVNQKLAGWKLPENEFMAEQPVTLRHLLSHTGGLTVHGFPGYPVGALLPTLHQILDGTYPANTDEIRVDMRPGSEWRYSGGGYCIAQELVILASGQRFPEYMEEAVLGPLGMSLSTYEQPIAASRVREAARAHDADGERVVNPWHEYPEMAAAGLWTTPSDLSRFLIGVRAAYLGEEGALLSADLATDMLTRQHGSDHGLGFSLAGDGDGLQFRHGGSNLGFRCVAMLARSGNGAVVMVNSGDNGVVQVVTERIGEIMGW